MKLVDIEDCDRDLFYKQCGGKDSLITVESAFNMLMALPIVDMNDAKEELKAKEDKIRADEREKVLAKVTNLKNEYTDACNMCTKMDCDVCAISNFIDQLENIISNK